MTPFKRISTHMCDPHEVVLLKTLEWVGFAWTFLLVNLKTIPWYFGGLALDPRITCCYYGVSGQRVYTCFVILPGAVGGAWKTQAWHRMHTPSSWDVIQAGQVGVHCVSHLGCCSKVRGGRCNVCKPTDKTHVSNIMWPFWEKLQEVQQRYGTRKR